jgi:hypothetical protein
MSGLFSRAQKIRSAIVGGNHCDGKSPLEPMQHFDECLFHRYARLIHLLQQVRDDLGVGFRTKSVPLALERGTQHPVICDNAVVHDGKVSVATHVRVGIRLRHSTVRRPSCMRDPERSARAGQSLTARHLFDSPGVLPNLDAGTVEGRHTAGIVTAIFQTRDAFHQQRRHFAAIGNANDPAHDYFPL